MIRVASLVLAALRDVDKKVVEAFVARTSASGNVLSTDGHSLEKFGLGAEKVAVWRGSKIAIVSTESAREEHKTKISVANTGKKRSPEVVAAIVATRTEPQWRDRVSNTNKETWRRLKAEGFRERKSEFKAQAKRTKTERRASAETKLKMSLARTGKKQSHETKAKRQASLKKMWAERKAGGGSGLYQAVEKSDAL